MRARSVNKVDAPIVVERRVVTRGTCQAFSGAYPNGKRREFTEYHHYYDGCLDYWNERIANPPVQSWGPVIESVTVEQRFITPWETVDTDSLG